MKVDSEAQRALLDQCLSDVTFEVTAKTIKHTAGVIFGLLKAVRGAGLERKVVPIESLAPDPPDLKVERG